METPNELTADFGGLRIASLESRRADDMARLITRHGGVAHVSPSMREVPIKPNRPAIDFAYAVMTGHISAVILLTGVGFRFLLSAIEDSLDKQKFIDALSDIPTVVRGPKPAAAMKEVGLTPTYRVPEPNTWRELLQVIDRDLPVSNLTVGLQEYGVTNASLVAGLEARGATVVPIRVYGWDYPLDPSLLEANVRAIAAGQRDVLMLTSAHQAVNMLRMAEQCNLIDAFRSGLRSTVIASIGPTTTQMLEECEIMVDIEPPHPKMGHLVVESAKLAPAIAKRKRAMSISFASPSPGRDPKARTPHASESSLFMRTCRGESTDRTPIWLMRQAGRYMAEYRSVREQQSFIDLCKSPKLCSEVMCTAVDRLKVDAAIIFSDLLPLLEPLGFHLEYVKGDGPVIHNPIRGANDVDRVKELTDPMSLGFVYETVSQTRADLPDDIPVIGFAGSPFTLASYCIEGSGSRQYAATKTLMYSDPGAWATLMQRLSHAVIQYLNHQIAAGAQAVQLFDSWAGCLSPRDYAIYVLPFMKSIIAGITPGVPVINFATGNPELLPMLVGDSRTIVGVDWRIPIDVAWSRIGHQRGVQGNLDPGVLLGSPEIIAEQTRDLLDRVGGRPGHIFNVGHGVMQQTPVENVIRLVELVKEWSTR